MARIVSIVLAIVLLNACMIEQEPTPPSVRILSYGILDYDDISLKPDQTSTLGAKLGQAHGLRVISQTDQIPIRPGLAYGIEFVVSASTDEVELRAVQKSSNPCLLKRSGKRVYYNDSTLKVRVGQIRHIGARFPVSETERICEGGEQPGIYTFELYSGNRKLAEKHFYVYRN
jgi:hypothetical protein